jgi:branched-chain amino acid transport system ATP-binding protein
MLGYLNRDRGSTSFTAAGGNSLTAAQPVSQAERDSNTLRAESVSVRFEGLLALSKVSLTLRGREIVGLIGPNGAGKSTLVNCLSGFQSPTTGTVLLGETSTAGWPTERFRHAGVARTFQGGRLFRDLSVYENVEATPIGLGLSRKRAARLVWPMLEWMRIADKATRLASDQNYTDERRVGIARALIMSPSFLLLDEPAAGMTHVECDELMNLIGGIPHEYGCGVLLIEHNMRVVMGLCDRIHVLDSGNAIAEGTPQHVRENKAVITAYLGETP